MAGCPQCGSKLRGSFKAGLWVCLGGSAVPEPYGPGPGLVNPFDGPGVIYHPRTRWVLCNYEYRVPDHELTDPERKWQELLFKEEERKTTPSVRQQADPPHTASDSASEPQSTTNTGECCRVTYEIDGHRVAGGGTCRK